LKSALILVGLGDGDIWVRPETYLVIVFAVVSTAGGVTVLNRGLKEYDALFIAPMYVPSASDSGNLASKTGGKSGRARQHT
jgi:hypothetical protein